MLHLFQGRGQLSAYLCDASGKPLYLTPWDENVLTGTMSCQFSAAAIQQYLLLTQIQ